MKPLAYLKISLLAQFLFYEYKYYHVYYASVHLKLAIVIIIKLVNK